MSRHRRIDKIYFKLVGLDFDNLSFTNHIVINEVLAELKALRDEGERDELPPPLPVEATQSEAMSNVIHLVRPKSQSELRVMILDEDFEMQSLVGYALRGEPGVDLTLERSPQAALRSIAKELPDVIMLDVQMKEMSCHEFISHLRKIDRTTSRSSLVLTIRTNTRRAPRLKWALRTTSPGPTISPKYASRLNFAVRTRENYVDDDGPHIVRRDRGLHPWAHGAAVLRDGTHPGSQVPHQCSGAAHGQEASTLP